MEKHPANYGFQLSDDEPISRESWLERLPDQPYDPALEDEPPRKFKR